MLKSSGVLNLKSFWFKGFRKSFRIITKEFPKAASFHSNTFPKAAVICLKKSGKIVNAGIFQKVFKIETGSFHKLFVIGLAESAELVSIFIEAVSKLFLNVSETMIQKKFVPRSSHTEDNDFNL